MRITVCDLETSGMAPPEAMPCEIGAVDVVADGDGWRVDWESEFNELCNPGLPIPPEVSAVHHIVDSDVADKPAWLDCLRIFSATPAEVLCAHNAKFERLWITDEVTGGKPWICTFKCALRLWPDAPGHSNQVLRYWLNPAGLDRQIAAVAHRAFPDAYVTAFLLIECLKLAPIESLIEWSSQPGLLTTIRFGKNYGKKFSELPTDYLQWMSRQDFDEDVMFTVRRELSERSSRDF